MAVVPQRGSTAPPAPLPAGEKVAIKKITNVFDHVSGEAAGNAKRASDGG